MKQERVREILSEIQKVRVAVYGDFALDAYWMLDPKGGEISLETGIQAQAVREHYTTLGGASNIIANLAVLEPAEIRAIGAIGDDIFGKELVNKLQALSTDTSGLVKQSDNFDTIVFAKRYLENQEQARIDFGFLNERSSETEQTILEKLEKAIKQNDAVIFNQQVPGSLDNEDFRKKINALFHKYPDKIIILDSRHYSNEFSGVIRKCNQVEAARLCGVDAGPDDIISLDNLKSYGKQLYDDSGKPVFITRGSRGMLVVDENGATEINGIQLMKKLDTVGAGDTSLSALGLCLAANIPAGEAAEVANFAAAVTVQKRFQTGTASKEEILEVASDPDYLYQPELAGDIRRATYHRDTEIEIVTSLDSLELGRIRHAVFDHDGTISVVREGWEQVMEPVMVKSILGEKYQTADQSLLNEVRTRSQEYIDQSTGIQTIIQMQALVDMVKEFGFVPEDQILDKFGYKEVYNDALMEMVNQRLAKLQSGQLDVTDYTLKGAVEFLHKIKDRGVTLYLASGTDRDDVRNEAEILGYAGLFDGGIYGAIGDVSKYSKKMVFDNIISENDLDGSEMVVFGDGPVEIRECRKINGISVGIASDEIRRHGLNTSKRSRLIKAGAHLMVPDFSQGDELLSLLFSD